MARDPGNDEGDAQRNQRNEGAVQNPPVTAAHNGAPEVAARADAHGCEEEGNAYLPDHQVGAGGGVGGYLVFGAEVPQQDGHDERSSGQSQFDGLGDVGEVDGDGAEDDAYHDAQEDGHQIGFVEGVVGISHHSGHLLDIFLGSHAHEAVAHLDIEGGTGHQFHAGADDTGHADAEGAAEPEVLDGLTGKFGVGDHDTAGYQGMVFLLPVLHMQRHFLPEENPQTLHFILGGHQQEFVALMKDRIGRREGNLVSLHHAGNHEVFPEVMDHVIKFLAEDGGILHGHVHAAGMLAPAFLFFQLMELLLVVYLENGLEKDNDHDDANSTI